MKKGVFIGAIFLLFVQTSFAQVYRVGVVPQFDARQLRSIWQPIIQELNRIDNLQLELVSTPSIPLFEERFRAGNFDFVYLNPYHLIQANRAQGYQPLFRDVKRELKGIVVVKNDSPLKTLADLGGKKVAFPAPNALGASLFVRAEIENMHVKAIMPRYVGNHDSVYLNVLLGLVDAGGGVYATLNQQKEEIRRDLRVLHTTRSSPAHPVAVHPRVPKEVVAQFSRAFQGLAYTVNGRDLLARVPIKQLGKASLSDYQDLSKFGLDKLVDEAAR